GGVCCFFFRDTASAATYPLSLHDALPIYGAAARARGRSRRAAAARRRARSPGGRPQRPGSTRGRAAHAHDGARSPSTPCSHAAADRKSTRLNSSHVKISYAVFCLKKKNKK